MFGREYSTTSSAAACAADAGVRTMYGAKPVAVVAWASRPPGSTSRCSNWTSASTSSADARRVASKTKNFDASAGRSAAISRSSAASSGKLVA